MGMKRFGAWGPQMASTAHIKVKKLEDGKYEASVLGAPDLTTVAADENRATRDLKERMDRESKQGK
jgi:hypothetical protein